MPERYIPSNSTSFVCIETNTGSYFIRKSQRDRVLEGDKLRLPTVAFRFTGEITHQGNHSLFTTVETRDSEVLEEIAKMIFGSDFESRVGLHIRRTFRRGVPYQHVDRQYHGGNYLIHN